LAKIASGNVVAVGGSTIGPFVGQWSETAEIFDIPSLSWGMVAPMNTSRTRGHTATSLSNGLILVIGGSISSTADLFDPFANEWTPIERSDDVRYHGHSSTALAAGEVLVTGGTLGIGSTDAAICDAFVFAWETRQSIAADSRGFHSSTVLNDGSLLLVGGADDIPNGSLQSLQDAWLYFGDQAESAAAPPPLYPRALHTATKLNDGRVFVAGGFDEAAVVSEIFDSVNATWTDAAKLPQATMRATASLLADGTVLQIGGIYSGGANDVADDVLNYDPDSNAWTAAPDMPENPNRFGHTSTILGDGSVLVTGGFTNCPKNGSTSTAVATAARYHPATNTWSAVAVMNQKRAFHSATLLKNGQVLIAGGGGNIEANCLRPTWNSVHASAEIYDPETDTWTTVGLMQEARTEHQALLLSSERVVVAGGRRLSTGRIVSSAEIYDPDTKIWTTTSRLQRGRYGHSLNLLPEGVLAIGGFHSFAQSEVSIERFPQAARGSACVFDDQCASAICSGGVCCNESCDNRCQACSKAAAEALGKGENRTEEDGICQDISGCSTFACDTESGQCKTECSDVTDCVTGHVCNPMGECIDALENASIWSELGCHASTTESNAPSWGSIVFVASALAARRYRRKAQSQDQRNS
jgi:N-acetylneuraminic acid mutarotase